jgi:hypothetical protein
MHQANFFPEDFGKDLKLFQTSKRNPAGISYTEQYGHLFGKSYKALL